MRTLFPALLVVPFVTTSSICSITVKFTARKYAGFVAFVQPQSQQLTIVQPTKHMSNDHPFESPEHSNISHNHSHEAQNQK